MGRSLLERFGERHDLRDRRGRRLPLVALLGLCRVSILAFQTSWAAIAPFGRLRGHALGFPNGRMPCANTLGYPLRDLDADQVGRLKLPLEGGLLARVIAEAAIAARVSVRSGRSPADTWAWGAVCRVAAPP